MTTDQFDNFQLEPGLIGSTWVFTGQQGSLNRAPNAIISTPDFRNVGTRNEYDRTRTVFAYEYEENPVRTIGTGFAGWGVDWALFNYNPYGMATHIDGSTGDSNVTMKVRNDFLNIAGLGGLDVITHDVMDENLVTGTMTQYYNYPTEGWNAFGKKGQKEWRWQGQSWIPSNDDRIA